MAVGDWNNIAGADKTVISMDGTTIAYRTFGSGSPVIVVPGVLSMASDYDAFARALTELDFSVHVIERRGRGRSGPQGDDYSVVKECEDVLALQAKTGATLLVGHSYGGLVALEVARNNPAFARLAVYEPGVSIDGSMPVHWMTGYESKLAEGRRIDALVEFTLADAPSRIRRIPVWLMKLIVTVLARTTREYKQMLDLLPQNLREWQEISRLDNSYESYRQIAGEVLIMYGGRSDSRAVDLVVERLSAVLPHVNSREFPKLDHFGIERTAPQEVAAAVAEFFTS
jgi:pimeloyl-ACP methyl ester carboxylesterase